MTFGLLSYYCLEKPSVTYSVCNSGLVAEKRTVLLFWARIPHRRNEVWDGSHARSSVALNSLLKNACKETENANSKLRGSCTKQHYCTFIGKSKVSAHALSPSRYQYCEYHCSEAKNSMYFDGNCTWSWPCLLLQFRSVNPISVFLPS